MFGWFIRGQRLCFTFKPGETIGIAGDGGEQHFDRNAATEFQVASAIDLSHPADAQRFDDFVLAEAGSGDQGKHLRGRMILIVLKKSNNTVSDRRMS
jgi:hypothetical protein